MVLAKQRWRILLDNVDFTTQLKLSEYAKNQQWFELAVDASIVAKAWGYLSLRLPNAYSEYFNAALQNLNISKLCYGNRSSRKCLESNGTIFSKCEGLNATFAKYGKIDSRE